MEVKSFNKMVMFEMCNVKEVGSNPNIRNNPRSELGF